MTTEILRCSVVEREAIKRASRGIYQDELLDGTAPWGGGNRAKLASQRSLIERLNCVAGLLVLEDNSGPRPTVTIWGSLTADGFGKKI